MNNKVLFLLSLSLFFCITECMKRKNICLTEPMNRIADERNNILKDYFSGKSLNTLYYFTNETYWTSTCIEIIKNLSENPETAKKINYPYSPLGMGAIAIEANTKESLSKKTIADLQNQPDFFKRKKESIQKLLDLGFTPTPEDKKLAILVTYEEFGPSIIQKKLLLQHYIPCFLKIDVPQEIKDYIPLLIFQHKLLF